MNARRGAVIAFIAIAGIFIWLFNRADREARLAAEKQPAPAARVSTAPTTPPKKAEPPLPPEARSELADQLNAPGGTIQADLKIVAGVIDTYRSNFHENPVGLNSEITTALQGGNRYHLALIPAGHPAVNAAGELCDRWGQPFFFHQISGVRMEIRSAGPDKKMWTEDDAVLTPQ